MSPLPLFAHVRSALPASSTAEEAAIRVVCAFPVSGQYGPGSRVLYYVVVVLCIIGRKFETLRNAALAVALVFPAVAALHSIVLASVHVNGQFSHTLGSALRLAQDWALNSSTSGTKAPLGVVDMDVYGAFQLCSIGILAGPTSIRLSKTYANARARGIIFLWTGLMVAGLVSLVVEFYRATAIPCPEDDYGNIITGSAKDFPYQQASCGLVCSEEKGPFSPMRGGAARNVYVIPQPDKLTFNTALIVAAACCIPAILSIAFTGIQDLDNNWRRRFGRPGDLEEEEKNMNEPIPGTNGATPESIRKVDKKIRDYQYFVEVPLFGAAVLAILIMGELNFFSTQVDYETEPIASIGQWGPIAGTIIAAFGTVWFLVVSEIDKKEQNVGNGDNHCGNCTCTQDRPRDTSMDLGRITSRRFTNETVTASIGGKMERAITNLGDRLSTAAHSQLDDSHFKTGEARGFPTIPGEIYKNPDLPKIQEAYNPNAGEEGDITSGHRGSRSRAPSFISVYSGLGITGTDTGPSASAGPSLSSPTAGARRNTMNRSPSPISTGSGSGSPGRHSRDRSRSPRTNGRRNTYDHCPTPTSPITKERRNTLEVPTVVYPKP